MKAFQKLFSFLLFLLLISSSSPLAAQRQRRLESILRQEKIRSYKVPIHLQSKEWLIKEFGPGNPYPINVTLATKNMVWHTRQQIQQGKTKPIRGIIRTFWYTHIKPVLARTESLNQAIDQSDVLNGVLVDLVRTRNIMRYKDMGFLNNNAGTVKLGKNWHVMLVGEKHGKFAVLEEMAKDLNATVFTLGGQPSLLSMEYIVDDYKAKGIDIRKSMYLIFVVDYDPAGWIIRDSVIRNLKFYGMKNLKAFDIVLPSILTAKELELAKIPKSRGTLNEKWLKRSGGINGELYGFESDSIPFEKLRKKIIEVATPFVGNTENIRRANAAEALGDVINRLAQIRLRLITE